MARQGGAGHGKARRTSIVKDRAAKNRLIICNRAWPGLARHGGAGRGGAGQGKANFLVEREMIEIKEGAFYRDGLGAVRGPMMRVISGIGKTYPWTDGERDYSACGEFFIGVKGRDNLVEEVDEPE